MTAVRSFDVCRESSLRGLNPLWICRTCDRLRRWRDALHAWGAGERGHRPTAAVGSSLDARVRRGRGGQVVGEVPGIGRAHGRARWRRTAGRDLRRWALEVADGPTPARLIPPGLRRGRVLDRRGRVFDPPQLRLPASGLENGTIGGTFDPQRRWCSAGRIVAGDRLLRPATTGLVAPDAGRGCPIVRGRAAGRQRRHDRHAQRDGAKGPRQAAQEVHVRRACSCPGPTR